MNQDHFVVGACSSCGFETTELKAILEHLCPEGEL